MLYILLTIKNNQVTSKRVLEENKDLLGLTEFIGVQIPKHKPITRSQYEAAKVLWPTQFYENKR